MVILFLLGTASINNVTTEYRTSYNYLQSVQAFNDAEAGIGEVVGIITTNRNPVLDTWIDTNSPLFQYSYRAHFDPNTYIFTITSLGFDPKRVASRKITAQYESLFNTPVIGSPVYSVTGNFTGTASHIVGNPNCPSWVPGSSDDSSVPAITTSGSTIDFEDQPDQCVTDDSIKIKYNQDPGIKFNELEDYYKDKATFTTLATNGTYGTQDEFELGYVTGNGVYGGITGYGILIIVGNVTFAGGCIWHGLIINIGNLVITGNGNKLYGGLISNGDCEVGGDAEIKWCPGAVGKALQDLSAPPLKLLSWKEE